MLTDYVVIDLEMTGLNEKTDRILEAGAARVRGNVPLGGLLPTLPLYWNHKGGRGMSLGTNISRLRAEKRLSQGDLAEVLEVDRKSTRLNSSHSRASRMPSSA